MWSSVVYNLVTMLNNVLKKIIYCLCLLTLSIIFLCSLLPVDDVPAVTDLYKYILIYLFIFILLFIVLFLLIRLFNRINNNVLYIIYFILIFVIPLMFYKLSIANVVYDGKAVFEFVLEALRGNYQQVFKGSYMAEFPWQFGLSLFWELILRICAIFNNNIFYEYSACLNVISLVNSVMSSLILLFGFLIVKKVSHNNELDKCIYVSLSLTCIPLFMYSLYLYNDIPSILFTIISTYFFIEYTQNNCIKHILLSIVFVGLSTALRFSALVFAITFMLIMVYQSLFEKRKMFNVLVAFMYLIIPLFISQLPYKYYETVSNYKNMVNIEEYQIDDGQPLLLNVSMGLDIGGGYYGWFNGNNIHTYVDICSLDSACGEQKAREQISSSLKTMSSNPLLTTDFFYHKMVSQWGDGSMGSLNLSPATDNNERTIVNFIFRGTSNIVLKCYAKAHLILVSLLTLLMMIKKRNVKELSMLDLTFEIIILGGFILSLFWETNSRYNMPYLYILIILASINFDKLIIKNKKHFYKITRLF